MGETLTFKKWRELGQSPRRLLEEYVFRNGLSREDIKQISLIIEYAAWLVKDQMEAKDAN